MASLLQIKQRFESLSLEQVAADVMEENSQLLADVQAEQMFKGIERSGELINPPYARRTVVIKREKGQPSDRVTLRDTGDFYQGLYVRVEGATLSFGSDDEKTQDLQDKYGDIFGLSSTFKSEFIRDTLKPAFRKKIRETTGL